MMTMMMRKNQE